MELLSFALQVICILEQVIASSFRIPRDTATLTAGQKNIHKNRFPPFKTFSATLKKGFYSFRLHKPTMMSFQF